VARIGKMKKVQRMWGWEVDGTGSGSCPMVGFGISSVEPFGSASVS
jgi:hypothetical protein